MKVVQVRSSGIPLEVREKVAKAVFAALEDRQGDWKISISDDGANNAWDLEVDGPNHFEWSRRFSAEDRDVSVITTALNDAIASTPKVA